MPPIVYFLSYLFAILWWGMSGVPWYVNLYLTVINGAALAAFFIDKSRAVRGEWRIPEIQLHALTLAGGVIGTGAGMVLARHKIRKPGFIAMYFVGLVPLCFIASAFAPDAPQPAHIEKQLADSHKAPHPARHKVAHRVAQTGKQD